MPRVSALPNVAGQNRRNAGSIGVVRGPPDRDAFKELVQEGQHTANNLVPALGRASLEGDMLGCKLAFVIHSQEQKPD